jgi:hypothetical protein
LFQLTCGGQLQYIKKVVLLHNFLLKQVPFVFYTNHTCFIKL